MFEYESLDGLLGTKVTSDQGVSIAFFYVDPDGNTIELTMDTLGNWNKSKESMKHSPTSML